MKTKRIMAVILAILLVSGTTALGAYAGDHGKKEGCHQGLEDKFFHKAHFLFQNKEELGLSDEQADAIKELKIKVKKDLIQKKAEIDVLALEVKSAMWSDSVDADAVNKLIDKKYGLKAEKAKSLVAAYTSLKGLLTKEQKEKMKDLRKQCKKEKKHSMMKGKR